MGMVGPCFLVRGKSPERLLKLYCSPLVQSSNSKQIHMGEVLSTTEQNAREADALNSLTLKTGIDLPSICIA